MSAADIADNRWEREAAQPEIFTPIGLLQLATVGAFTLFFAGVVIVSLWSIIAGPQESELERSFRQAQMRNQAAAVGSPAPAPAPGMAAPAAAPAAVPNPAAGQPAAVPPPAH